ncbi:MAG: ABC transporter ATP-binding protein [Clostridia bacterium]|nr:ABC transporter ATP-binding protein [Clostridia bacterium]
MEIILKNVSKSFDGKQVIRGLSHTFSSSLPNVITGASGCGKTTLINMLLGTLKPDSGEIIIPEGTRFSAVFQEDRLIENMSVFLNVKLVANKNVPREKISRLISEIGLADSEFVQAKDLSGGMKRRTAIARALVADFDVLILDEPFNGLDQENKTAVFNLINNYAKDKLIIYVTHDLSVLSDFSRLCL